jgi:TolA-binding protein/predicted negative regulator of RcsB-dependent stress response
LKLLKNYKKGLLITAFFLCLLPGCAVQEWSSVKQAYRDFVAYYNAYFHAVELLEKSKITLSENHTNDFQRVIDIYPLGSEDDVRMVRNDLERVIEKSTLVIQGYKNSNWVDDSYLLIGKARFYKQEYREALESFQHISSRFRGTPPGYEALVWLVITNTRMERYNEARSVVSMINSDEKFPEELKRDFLIAKADLMINRQNYSGAIEALEEAIPMFRRDRDKSRYRFILAQLYQRRGNMLNANELFADAARRAPTYELEFQANFNRVLTIETDNIDAYRDKRRKILRMIDNDNNEPYLDMLYYELGELELFARNQKQAIKHFQTSLDKNRDNKTQRARTLNRLASLKYENKRYTAANQFFTELRELTEEEFEGRDTLRRKADHYSAITGYHVTITLQDSLLELANLDDETLRRKMTALSKKLEADEKAGKREPVAATGIEIETPATGANGSWYFYNPTALNNGYQQFQNSFGNRPQTDYWRYRSLLRESLREREDLDDDESEFLETFEDEEKEKEAKPSEDDRVEELIASVPRSDAQKNAVRFQIMEAYFNLSFAYYENVNQYQKALVTLETLNQRFPDNRYLAHSYYLLYSSANHLGKKEKANYYSELLQKEFPGSEFNLLVNDPQKFYERFVLQERNPELEKKYLLAYQAYNDNNCGDINQLALVADTAFVDNYLESDFTYLSLLCELRTDTATDFTQRLKNFIAENEGTELGAHAQNILDFKQKKSGKQEGGPEHDFSKFSNKQNETHFYCLVFNLEKGSTREYQRALSNFHNHILQRTDLNISDRIIGDNYQMLIVRKFDSRSEAMIYFNNVKNNEMIFREVSTEAFEHFVISESNFKELRNMETKRAYLAFFNKYYE